MSEQKKAMWAIIELMGHQRMAGLVTEETVAGHGFLRVDVPEAPGQPPYTRFLSPASIYAINPTTEELARRAAQAWRPKPVNEWELPTALPAAPPPMRDADDEEDQDEDDDFL